MVRAIGSSSASRIFILRSVIAAAGESLRRSSMDLTAAEPSPLMLGSRFPGPFRKGNCALRKCRFASKNPGLGRVGRQDAGGLVSGARAPLVPRPAPVLDHPPLLRVGVVAFVRPQRAAIARSLRARSSPQRAQAGGGLCALA